MFLPRGKIQHSYLQDQAVFYLSHLPHNGFARYPVFFCCILDEYQKVYILQQAQPGLV